MNNLELLIRAVKDYYKVESCGVCAAMHGNKFLITVKDDNGENVCQAESDTLANAIDRVSTLWLRTVSPSGALFKLLQATSSMPEK
jgi:hypothetical protein